MVPHFITVMRWSGKVALQVAAAYATAATVYALPAPPGEPTEGATSIDVMATEVAGVSATGVAARQEATTQTYNNGLYTPWSDPAASTADAATEASESAPSSDESVYLQPTEAIATTSVDTALSSASVIATTPPAASTSSLVVTTSSSTSETLQSSTQSSTASASSSSSSSISRYTLSQSSHSSRVPFSATADGAQETQGAIKVGPNGPKMGLILPVSLSLGILALVLAVLLLLAYRRRRNKRRRLNNRRYEDNFGEKGSSTYNGMPSEYGDDEKDVEGWKTFQRNSLVYDDLAAGAAAGMAGAGTAAGRGYGSKEVQEAGDRGWQWGAQNRATPVHKIPRRPLPHTPQRAATATMPTTESMTSLHQDLDAMIAESRTGYQPYAPHPPARENSIKNVANAIYSSLSMRSKRFGTRGSAKSSSSSRKSGQWDEHGAWMTVDDDASIYEEEEHEPVARKKSKILAEIDRADSATNKPLLSVQDDTPRKGYSTYTPPDTPSRADTPHRHQAASDTDVAEAGGSSSASMQYSHSADSPQARRYRLQDKPVAELSPDARPNRTRSTRSKTLSYESEPYDSPSCYSPSVFTHAGDHSPAPTFPDSLQPGRSPALGSRPVSPAIPSQQYALAQSTKSGTTYSLSGMAGLLYNHEAMIANHAAQAKQNSNFTALPPRKPRKQSVKAKAPVRGAKSPLSASSEDPAPSPHRLVSAVVKASRARAGSSDSKGSEGSEGSVWNQQVRGQLRQSPSSSSSVDDLLTNILGPARSPA